jgi:dihydroorotate dehydrogenase
LAETPFFVSVDNLEAQVAPVLKLGKFTLEPPVITNAGGMLKTTEDVRRAAPAADAPEVGSATPQPRDGNRGDTYWYDRRSGSSYNSLNMPNGGIPYYEQELPKMVEICGELGKPLIFNVAGFSDDDYLELDELGEASGASAVLFNFGCPNTEKKIMSYDLVGMMRILAAASRKGYGRSIGAKLSPETNPVARQNIIQLLADYVDFFVLTNTLANIRAYRLDGSTAIKATSPDGNEVTVGGGAGSCLRDISRTYVAECTALAPNTPVIRAGGISSGIDVLESERAGAAASAVATAWMEEGPAVCTRLRQEYAELIG